MESLFGMSYLKNGDITLRMVHRSQADVRKSILAGLPAAPVRLSIIPAMLLQLAEMLKTPKYRILKTVTRPH
jgi:hypothetical protein